MGLQNKEDKIIELLKDISSKLDQIILNQIPKYPSPHYNPTIYGPVTCR